MERSITVGDLMTSDPVVVHPDDSVEDAATQFLTSGARHIPVVDDRGGLLGIISDRDMRGLLGADSSAWPNAPKRDREQRMSEVMAQDPISLNVRTPLATAIDIFADDRVGAIPIVDDRDIVVGILSYVDVLQWVRNQIAPEAELGAPA